MRRSNAHQLSRLKKWQKAWDILAKEVASSAPDAAILYLQLAQLTGWAEVFPAHQADWSELASYVAEQYQDLIRRYESELRRACREREYEIEGEFPTFMVDGLVKVSVNKEQNVARVNAKKTKSLSLASLMDTIAGEHQRLWERDFDPLAFLERLRVAYASVCKAEGVPEGDYVYLRDIFQALKAANGAYSPDLFAADISRLIEGRLSSYAGHSLDFAPIRDSRQAVYVYDRTTRSGRYLGLLRFKKG